MRVKPPLYVGTFWINSRQKRAFDVMVVSVLLPFLVVLIMILMILIVIIDGAVPVFTQTRIGKHGVPFTFYKLNTMGRNRYDDVGGGANDQRATIVGKFLRMTTLDETPQLVINVLRGDMSLVGPRPLLQHDIDLMRYRLGSSHYAVWYAAYQIGRPGWTGSFGCASRYLEPQSGAYLLVRKKYDVSYRKQASFWGDVHILFAHFLIFYIDIAHRNTVRSHAVLTHKLDIASYEVGP